MAFTKTQREQVARQLQMHNRKRVQAEIPLNARRNRLFRITIERGVFGSDIMNSSIHLAGFLDAHRKIYRKKKVLDMGCGPGTQGIIMALNGAKQVTFSDINPRAVKNTNQNARAIGVWPLSRFLVSDLFKAFPKKEKFDVIVFNHPFFSGKAEKFGAEHFPDVRLRATMLGGTTLIKRFLREAPKHLMTKDSIIIMPYFHFAGKENDPKNHAAKYGLRIERKFKVKLGLGKLQKGAGSIYILVQAH